MLKDMGQTEDSTPADNPGNIKNPTLIARATADRQKWLKTLAAAVAFLGLATMAVPDCLQTSRIRPSHQASAAADMPRSRARRELDTNLRLLCGRLAAALRAGRIPNDRLDLQGASSFDCPLGAVDLSQTVLTVTTFNQIAPSAALNAAGSFRQSDWTGTNWWDAQELDAPLLAFLRDNYYPYANGNTNYLSVPPAAQAYQDRVLSLCKKAKIECSRATFRYGPQSTARIRQILAALSVPAVATLVTRANEGAIVTLNPGRVAEHQAIGEWLRAGLCDSVASGDLQSGGLARTSAGGFGARRVHCMSIYGDVRRFLNSIVGPEYMIVTTEVGSQPEQKLPESVALASVGVRNAALSLSAEAIGFLLTNVPPITYNYRPDSTEQQLHRELIDLHLCALFTPPELLEYDRQNHHSQGTSVYGLNCSSPDYQGMQDLVVSGLLPRYLETLTRGRAR